MLANVELALTLSGVSKAERRRRATDALVRVGLGDQLKKKPNQMSGGQMQRVAIARAIVNDPDILLADEPTGALDTTTSLQIMEILEEIASDRLVVMVTHNPELAEQYSTRIVKLLDGKVTDDSNPYHYEYEEEEEKEEVSEEPVADDNSVQLTEENEKKPESVVRKSAVKKNKKTSMSFGTALSLSLNNLMTKKGRTVLTSFAGSIGIIGIALILALSTGIKAYIDIVQEDTLSTYPLSINKEAYDLNSMVSSMQEVNEVEDHSDSDKIYVDDSLGTMMGALSATKTNDLVAFKKYIEENADKFNELTSDIQYTYDFDLQVYSFSDKHGMTQINPTTIFENMGGAFSGVGDMMDNSLLGGMGVMSEMIDNRELLDQQYEVVAGEWADEADEVVLVVSHNNQISKMTLYMLGVLDQGELEDVMKDLMDEGKYDTTPIDPFSYDDFLNMPLMLVNTADFYSPYNNEDPDASNYREGYGDNNEYPVWHDERKSPTYDAEKFVKENGMELKITGIIRPKEGVSATSISGAIGYTHKLTDLILEKNLEHDMINQQKETPEINVLTGLPFEKTTYTKENIDKLIRTIDSDTMDMFYASMTETIHETFTINEETFVGIIALMSDAQLHRLVSNMALCVPRNALAGICQGLSTPTISVTPDNIIDLLPIFTTEQKIRIIMGMSQMCTEENMAKIFDGMNEELQNISINESNFHKLLIMMPDEDFDELQKNLLKIAPQTDATLASNLALMGDSAKDSPASINFYAKDFESKDAIKSLIEDYNKDLPDNDKLKYSDMIGVLMSSVSDIIDVISYVLIAFVAVSLVVSSIMIGIITYISVLERTKEIGILRAMGASKGDIARVFNAETLIVGFAAGVIGILVTLLLTIPINAVVYLMTGIPSIKAILPIGAALILVGISMILTVGAGLIPSLAAAKKDPVVSLRTE